MLQYGKLLGFYLLLLSLSSCYQFNNPVDPDAPNYQGYPSDPGWLEGWTYRKRLQVENPSGQTATDYAIRITVHYGSGSDSGENVYMSGRCRSDFGDVRFTSSDSESVYDHWLQSKSDGDAAVVWVEVPSIPPSDGAVLYCYYGNASASSLSNGEATFLFFDDFEGYSIDTNKWAGDTDQAAGEWYVSGGSAWCHSQEKTIYSKNDYTDVESLVRIEIGEESSGFIGIRGNPYGEPVSQYRRYDLYFESDNGGNRLFLKLRKLASASFSVLQTDDWSSYGYDYLSASLGGAGSQIEAEARSSVEQSQLSAKDSDYPQGHVSIGTGSLMNYGISVDWFVLRPLIDPEPTCSSWGSEETK
jgi:hypothetical protein